MIERNGKLMATIRTDSRVALVYFSDRSSVSSSTGAQATCGASE
ncbi:MAG: hypothetical protein WB973_15895 [Thermoanaerobaculia bacterium]